MAIDKEISKQIFIANNILTPPYIKFNFKKNFNLKNLIKKVNQKLKFPVVLKPINEGSSVGVYITNKKNFNRNLLKLEKFKEVLIEKYIPGREIQAAILGNKKLGIIGYGRLGKMVAKYGKAFGMKVLANDIDPQKYDKNIIPVKLSKLLKESDIISVNAKLNKTSFRLIDSNEISLMKKS